MTEAATTISTARGTLDNPLLREPLRLEHVKPRLLGHWGTTPGLNFVDAHMNASSSATTSTRST
jgi:phosphoketolase